MTNDQLKELMTIFNEYRRKVEPLCGVAKKTSLVPFQVAVTLCLHVLQLTTDPLNERGL